MASKTARVSTTDKTGVFPTWLSEPNPSSNRSFFPDSWGGGGGGVSTGWSGLALGLWGSCSECGSKPLFAGWLQTMWAQLHILWARGTG